MMAPTILVVEDDPSSALDLRQILTRLGYIVPEVATHRADAIVSALKVAPDIVLIAMDSNDELDGVELARRVRERMDAPVIFAIAGSDGALFERAHEFNPAGFVRKPYAEQEIRAAVEIALIQHKAERAQQALRENEELYHTLVSASPDAIAVTDLDGKVIFASPVAEKLFHTNLTTALNTDILQWIAPADHAKALQNMQNLFRDQVLEEIEYSLVKADGTVFIGEVNSAILRDTAGKPRGMVAIIRDVTERKRVEASLRESEQLYRVLMDKLPDVALVYADGKVVYANPATATLMEYSPEEVLGKPLLHFVAPADRALVIENTRRRQRGELLADYEISVCAKSGNKVRVIVRAEQITYAGVPAVLVVLVDITERIQAEQELAHREAILEAIAFASEQLLRRSWKETILEVLAWLGRATNVGRVYLAENVITPETRFIIDQRYEWIAPLSASQIKPGIFTQFDPFTNGFERWVEVLEVGGVLQGRVRKFPEREQEPLASCGIQALIVAPIFVEGLWWGILGLEDAIAERDWLPVEIEMVKTVAATLGAAMARDRSDESLRQSEDRNRAILHAIPDTMFILNRDGVFLDYHAVDPRGLWVPPERFLGQPIHQVMPPVIGAEIMRHIERALAAGQVQIFDFPLSTANGTRHYELRLFPYGGDRILAIVREVTLRKQTEESLARERNLLRTLIDQMPDYVYVKDTQGRYVLNNQAHLHSLGLGEQHQALGKTSFDFFSSELAEHFYADEMQVIRIGQPLVDREETVREHHSAKTTWHLTTKAPLRDNQGLVIGLVGISRDITERKRMENQARESEERFRSLFEDSPDAMILTDAATSTIVDCNAAACKMNGYTRSELVDQPISLLDAAQVFDADTYVRKIHEEGVLKFDTIHRRKDGTLFPVEVSTKMIVLDGRKLTLGIDRDITERKQIEEAEREQHNLYEALRDSADALNGTLQLDQVIDRILENVGRVVPHDAANIMLVDEETKLTRIVRSRGYSERGGDISHVHVALAEAPSLNQMMKTGLPIAVSDVHSNSGWIETPDTRWIRSYAGAPIRYRRQTIGFLNVDSGAPGFFNFDHADHLQAFADQAAIAIQNARLYDDANRHANQMERVNQIGLAINAGLDLDQVVHTLYEQCQQAVPLDVFYVALYDQHIGNLVIPLFIDRGKPRDMEPLSIHPQPGLTGYVIKTKKTLYLPDTLDPTLELTKEIVRLGDDPARSYVGVPLILRDQVIGVLSMQSYQPNAYTADQIRFWETIGTQAAVAIENARLYAELQTLAVTDPLTGLFNRRGLFQVGEREVERAFRFHHALSVVLLDIDHFKRVNDRYGHPQGDLVLTAIADACRKSVRTVDIVARYGGEEFILLLPETDLAHTLLVAERLRRMVQDMRVLLEVKVPGDEPEVSVTLSLGVASMTMDTPDLTTLIKRADQAMYAAKQSGRNRVASAE